MKQPMNPIAGAAGPGKFSKRTDKMPSAYYGEGTETAAISGGAPKAKTRGIADNVGGRPANPLAEVTPLYAPTQRPTEEVTTGIDIGPGAGSSVLGLAGSTQSQYQNAAQLIQALAADPNSSPTMKYLAQRIQQVF